MAADNKNLVRNSTFKYGALGLFIYATLFVALPMILNKFGVSKLSPREFFLITGIGLFAVLFSLTVGGFKGKVAKLEEEKAKLEGEKAKLEGDAGEWKKEKAKLDKQLNMTLEEELLALKEACISQRKCTFSEN